MSEIFDTNRVRDDIQHWDALAERIALNASRRPSAIDWLAKPRVALVGASIALAATLVFLVTMSDRDSARDVTASWSRVLAPPNDLAAAMVSREGPPSVASLLLVARGEAR